MSGIAAIERIPARVGRWCGRPVDIVGGSLVAGTGCARPPAGIRCLAPIRVSRCTRRQILARLIDSTVAARRSPPLLIHRTRDRSSHDCPAGGEDDCGAEESGFPVVGRGGPPLVSCFHSDSCSACSKLWKPGRRSHARAPPTASIAGLGRERGARTAGAHQLEKGDAWAMAASVRKKGGK